jgi:hypothetical protein
MSTRKRIHWGYVREPFTLPEQFQVALSAESLANRRGLVEPVDKDNQPELFNLNVPLDFISNEYIGFPDGTGEGLLAKIGVQVMADTFVIKQHLDGFIESLQANIAANCDFTWQAFVEAVAGPFGVKTEGDEDDGEGTQTPNPDEPPSTPASPEPPQTGVVDPLASLGTPPGEQEGDGDSEEADDEEPPADSDDAPKKPKTRKNNKDQ